MAPETYYFFFSILAAFAPAVFMTNMAYYRLKGKNLIGKSFKPGTIEHDSMLKYSSNRSLAILGAISLLGIANLVYNITRLLHLQNQEYVRFILVFAPVFVILITIAVSIKIYRQFGNGKYKKAPRKHKKDDDSWLS